MSLARKKIYLGAAVFAVLFCCLCVLVFAQSAAAADGTAAISAEGQFLLWLQEFARHPILTAILVPVSRSADHGIIWIVLAVVLLALGIVLAAAGRRRAAARQVYREAGDDSGTEEQTAAKPGAQGRERLRRAARHLVTVAVAAGIALLLSLLFVNILIKPAAMRARPYTEIESLELLVPEEKDFSFPSGHSSSGFAFAVAVFFALPKGKKRLGIPAIAYAAVVAYSRLYVGVHYPTDVIIGALIGTGCGILGALIAVKLRKIFEKAEMERSRKADRTEQ